MSLADHVRRYGGGPSTYTAQQIMDLDSSEPTTLVPGFISQGVTLLVSKPKIGKSYLCLHIGLGVPAVARC